MIYVIKYDTIFNFINNKSGCLNTSLLKRNTMLFIELVFSLIENPIDRPHNEPTAVQQRHKTDRTKSTPDSKWDQAPATDDNTLLFTPGLEL